MFISRFPLRCTLFALRHAPLSATHLLMTAADEEMSSFTVLRERVWTRHISWQSSGSTWVFDTQQEETYRTTPGWKQAIKTDFLPCHSVSSVSKYSSLHLNLIRIFLGIHYPYLLLVLAYQQMLAYLYWDPDKICATPVMLESSPTSSE